MEKIWLPHYDSQVPHEIDPEVFSSVDVMVRDSMSRFRARPAFYNRLSFASRTMNYRQVDDDAQAFGAYLALDCQLKKGERIAMMMPNLLQYPIALYGALRAGQIVVNVNPLYTPRELLHQLRDSGASTIVIAANFAHVLVEVIAQTSVRHVIVTELGDMLGIRGKLVNFLLRTVKHAVPPYRLPQSVSFLNALAQGGRRAAEWAPTRTDLDDIAVLQYTGGTTGVAKGAMLTHRNMIANAEQVAAMSRSRLCEGKDVFVCPLPLYHIFALTVNCLCGSRLGAFNILITNPRDLPALVADLQRHRITLFIAVNTLLGGLLRNKAFRKLDFKSWKFVLAGGMAVQQAVAESWLTDTGVPVVQGYGLTEASPVVSCNPIQQTRQFNGTAGVPLPSTDIDIRDESGKSLPVGEIGVLWTRGPQVMHGYWQQADETAKVLDENGWLNTGDIAQIDSRGYITLVDRKKDMILVSGFNVYPNEVEDVVAMHPGVAEVACIGVPHEKTGETVKIFVVKKDPQLTAEALITYCRTQLTGYKVPHHVEFCPDIPKTNVGKVLRRELREKEKAV